MNRAQIVDYVTTQTGLLAPEDISACQKFVSKRYELIYNSFLWKDTLGAVNLTVDPADPTNADGQVILPEVIDHVVGVRTPTNSLRVYDLQDFYRIDYDQFSQLGSAWKFALLPPLWFIWRGYSGLKVVTDPTDAAAQFKVTWRDNSGLQYTQLLQNGATLNPTPSGYSNVIPVGAVYDEFAQYTLNDNGLHTTILAAGKTYFYYDAQAGVNGRGFLLNSVPVANGSVFVATTDCFLLGDDTVVGLPVTAVFIAQPTKRIEIESFFKPSTVAAVSLNPQLPGDSDGGTLVLSATASPSYCRIRIFPIPNVKVVLSILGKRRFTPLDFDQEVPLIRNLDNCLIAFAAADMLTVARRFGQAAQKMQEGEVLLKELSKLYAIQESNFQRFVPDSGFGDAWTGPNQSGYWGIGGW